MHPEYAHVELAARDPDAALERRIEVALQSGVPEEPMRKLAEQRKGQGIGIAELVRPDRELVPGVEVETDLGTWTVHETPGHAPSHVCLLQPERRLLISGDHLLGRVSTYYDFGYTPDPAGEYLRSLEAVDRLDARLCLPGHGRTFTDVHGHVDATQTAVRAQIEKVREVVGAAPEPLTAFEAIPIVYGAPVTPLNANWWLSETNSYLRHLEVSGRVEKLAAADGQPDRWRVAAA
jgi:glyoxylase-like metal-dependent hydrolase (beta-lactamase superfamily II)